MHNVKKPLLPILLAGLIIGISCQAPDSVKGPALTAQDTYLCDSLRIDTAVVLAIRAHTDSILKPFPFDLEMLLDKDMDIDSSFQPSAGFVFHATRTLAEQILADLYGAFREKGYTILLLDRNFGFGGRSDVLAVLHTVDKYRILQQVQTDGANFDIDNDSLLSVIRRFDKAYSLDLVGAGGDWCEFTIGQPPTDWMTLAKEAYAVCPDIVDQGTGSVEQLAEEMKRTRRLYFWWD